MSASRPQRSDEVRIGHTLNENEEMFARRRRNAVQQSLEKLNIHCSREKVPNIALLGSGGGQRAMVGLLGSLVPLGKAGLLDCVLYLSGVSGSTWCMASLYQQPDWSTNLEDVKNQIISSSAVTWTKAWKKLKKYYYEKDNFSLTDVWATMVVTAFMEEIDKRKPTDQQDQHNKDPFPIYTLIDKQCKQSRDGDPWFEISPYEAGYSLTGAFVDTSSFGSKFHNGRKIKPQPEVDMLYLQALCGSALADGEEIIWEAIIELVKHIIHKLKMEMTEEMRKDPNFTLVDKCSQVLMDLVDMNLAVLQGTDASHFDESIRTKLDEISGGKTHTFQVEKLDLADKEAARLYMKKKNVNVTLNVCNYLSRLNDCFSDIFKSIHEKIDHWIWGRNYNFLHGMTDTRVPPALLESETRDYIDAGVLLNSPYFSVLRKERNTDLIISLDFSDGDPFMTVKEAANMCRNLNIPFPQVNIPDEDVNEPKDFYVFKGQNVPTVIHMPLFNVVNCGGDYEDRRNEYRTFQLPYSPEMINALMDVAGKNISNNTERLKEEICAVIGQKELK